jgi:isoleucyl-tRNA synthetase
MDDLNKIEQEILKYWEENKIYQKVKQKGSKKKKFFFCDGPPYATGEIHPGTAWNKTLKDSILRYYRANGYDVNDKPGYDTHGLPIEVKVEKELGIEDKGQIDQYGIEKFIKKCKEFATKYIKIISNQFKRCGVWMDWDNPYITYENYYIQSIWKTIKAADQKGLLKQGEYVVPYSPDSQTTLANYELEYRDRTDPSIYVRFKLADKQNEYFLIWTTTPWTLIANKAVMVHPLFEYIKVKVGNDYYYIAKGRESILKEIFDQPYEIASTTTGKKLEGISYIHPLQAHLAYEFDRKVILSDQFVSLEEGTGLVHTAPGHGPEDFKACKAYSIEPFCPVDLKGVYTKEAGKYQGLKVLEANQLIIEDLKKANALVYQTTITHRYPHDWRKKTPLIYITTKQWFISISDLKDKMLQEIDKNINFHPDFAKTRFRDFVSSAPDWCISRQRYWGTPLPIWVCENCSHYKVIGSIEELPNKDIDLHRPYIDQIKFECPKCKHEMKRIPDILDVWFDSGNAPWAQFSEEEKKKLNLEEYLADFIIEGKDQTRGWFYSLLGSGLIMYDKTCYKNLTMHGFFVDEKGEKMSKSVGNFVPLEEILQKSGADAFRLWGLSSTTWDDLRFNWESLQEAKKNLNIIINIGVWLERFYQPQAWEKLNLEYEIEDLWLLSKSNSTIAEVSKSFEEFEPFRGLNILKNFLIEDISRFYLKRIKTRLTEKKNHLTALKVLYDVFFNSLKMLSCYCPFVSEYIYLKVYKKYENLESISLFDWPKYNQNYINQEIETNIDYAIKILNAIAAARTKANIKLRWPVEKIFIYTDSIALKSSIEKTAGIIKSMGNCLEIEIGKPTSSYEIKINNSAIGMKFKSDSPYIIEKLKSYSAQELIEKLKTGLVIDEKYKIEKEFVEINEIAPGFSIAEFDGGKVYVSSVIKKELYTQALLKEIIRRIQIMRKELDLINTTKIKSSISGDEELVLIAYENSSKVGEITNSILEKNLEEFDLEKEWEIEDKKITIKIKKLN